MEDLKMVYSCSSISLLSYNEAKGMWSLIFFQFWFQYLGVNTQMSDNYDWEEWDESATTFRQHVLAGCVAGVSEHIVFFPIDTVRVCAILTFDHVVDQSTSSE